MATYDVVVIGAGIEGSAAAYYLRKKGLNVLLLEQVQKFLHFMFGCRMLLFGLFYSSQRCTLEAVPMASLVSHGEPTTNHSMSE